MRDDISAVDVLMMVKGVCEAAPPSSTSIPASPCASSTWSAPRSARPGAAHPLRGRQPTLEDLERVVGQGRPSGRRGPRHGLAGGAEAARSQLAAVDAPRARPGRGEHGRRGHHAGAHAGAEVALDPLARRRRCGGRRRTAPGPAPARCARRHRCGSSSRPWSANRRSCISQKRPWTRGGLGGAGGRPGARVAGADREVAEHHLHRQALQPAVQGGAERALEVGVLDHQRRLRRAPAVVVGPRLRGRARSRARSPAARRSAAAGRRRSGWPRADRPATAPDSSTARRRRGRSITSARWGKPPGW